ncbi:MAG: hypothetical protein DMF63_13830 [Acidobacteria bacterium]|nr:MAG: hypothetical protein DMF63_13830 [Acidobacteriota bacterium]
MKTTKLIFFAVLAFSCSAVTAQTVTITPKKTIYRRPKPEVDFKRTFTVRRPVAKAATPALSRKITLAISPEKVLELNIREEMGESQWLEEADYKVLFNQNGVLCIEQWMTGTAAYPDSSTKRVVVDIAKGVTVLPAVVFKDLPAFAKLVKKSQDAEIAAAKKEMKSDPDANPEELFEQANFTPDDFTEFSVDANGVTIYYDYGFPHVLEALQPSGEYHFTWMEIKQFVRADGLLARFVR